MRNHRITKDLLSHLLDVYVSQSSSTSAFALFGRFPIGLSGTFVRLRYFLGGDRPSQTTHQTVSLVRMTDAG